jgi:GDP-4-dehydro-6-deoxy-D-mannose reductase
MSLKECLITGGEGFIGSHLADLLVAKGLPVYATAYGDMKNIEHLRDKITILECDLKDERRVREVINRVRPELVFHLAAQSFVTVSWEDPGETLLTNVMGTFYLLDGIRRAGLDPVIEVVESSSVYGPCDESEMPLSENREFRPTSMYAVSKVGEDMLGYFYGRSYGLKVIRVRPFNMTGPRKTGDACSDFARGIAEVEKGIKRILEVGNLNTVRDFTDGRDAVEALWLLSEKGKCGEVYNLGSGKARSLDEILNILVSLSDREIEFRLSGAKMRDIDDPIYISDNTRLRQLGWEPRIPIEKTLSDTLDYWRENVGD